MDAEVSANDTDNKVIAVENEVATRVMSGIKVATRVKTGIIGYMDNRLSQAGSVLYGYSERR